MDRASASISNSASLRVVMGAPWLLMQQVLNAQSDAIDATQDETDQTQGLQRIQCPHCRISNWPYAFVEGKCPTCHRAV